MGADSRTFFKGVEGAQAKTDFPGEPSTTVELSRVQSVVKCKLGGVARGLGRGNPPYRKGDCCKLFACEGKGNGLGPDAGSYEKAGSDTSSQSEITDGDVGNICDDCDLLFVYHMEPHRSCMENHKAAVPELDCSAEGGDKQEVVGLSALECG